MNTRGENKSSIYYGWWIVVSSFVLLFLHAGAGFYSFGIFIKPLETHFGWSRSEISFAMSIYFVGRGLVGPFVGRLTETLGPKKILTLFTIATGATFILVSFTSSLWYFYGIYALLSIVTTGISYIPVSSMLARWFIKKRGLAFGIAMVGVSMGGFIMAPVVNFITDHYSWRLSFVCLGVLVWVLALPLTLFVVKGSPDEKGLFPDNEKPTTNGPNNTDILEQGWPFSAAIRSSEFPWISLAFFLAPLAQMGVLQHQVPLITELGISQAVAATALGFTSGLGGLGKLIFGWVTEKVPFHYVAMICFGLQAVGVLILINAASITMVWIYVFIFGFAMGGVVVLMPLVVGHFFGLTSFGTLIGVLSLVQAFGWAGGTAISGLVYDYFGSYQYALIFYIGIYLLAVLAIALAGRPRTYHSEPGHF